MIFAFEDVSYYTKQEGKVGEAIEVMTAFAGSIVRDREIRVLVAQLNEMMLDSCIVGKVEYRAVIHNFGVGHACRKGLMGICRRMNEEYKTLAEIRFNEVRSICDMKWKDGEPDLVLTPIEQCHFRRNGEGGEE